MPQLQHEFCTVEGCERPHKARGYCATHYMQVRKGVEITPVIRARSREFGPVCSVEGCNKEERALGLCNTHYVRHQRHGSTEFRPRWKKTRPCCIEGCDAPVYAHDMCIRHYAKNRDWSEKGLTTQGYLDLAERQKWVCAICERPENVVHESTGKARDLAVDHCHDTNVIRGLLCTNCNRALGLFQDSPELLRKAAAYLDPHKQGAEDLV